MNTTLTTFNMKTPSTKDKRQQYPPAKRPDAFRDARTFLPFYTSGATGDLAHAVPHGRVPSVFFLSASKPYTLQRENFVSAESVA